MQLLLNQLHDHSNKVTIKSIFIMWNENDTAFQHCRAKSTSSSCWLSSKQLLLFVFAWRSVCQYSMAEENPAAQRQTAVTAYFTSKQLLLFVFI